MGVRLEIPQVAGLLERIEVYDLGGAGEDGGLWNVEERVLLGRFSGPAELDKWKANGYPISAASDNESASGN